MNNSIELTPNTTIFREQWLPLELAIQRVAKFERDFGKAPFVFACHAALPSILTPELTNLIRINFLEKSVEWIAESDLLLSPLCHPINQGIFEIEPQVRQVLLVALQTDPDYGMERLEEIAYFLHAYNKSPLVSKLPAHIRRTYQWISDAYLDADATVQSMFDFLNKTVTENLEPKLADYLQVGKTLALIANPLEMTSLQVELEDLVGSSQYAALYWYGDKRNLITALQSTSSNIEGVTQTLTSSIANWLTKPETTELGGNAFATTKRTMATTPEALKNLVEALKLRKRYPGTPYNILLTSTISLTPNVVKRVSSSTSWEMFCRHIYKLRANSRDLVKFLTEYVGIHNNIEGYRALAHLILEGYFSTILTTNIDSTLEDLLIEEGLRPALLQTLIVGYDRDEDIIKALTGDLPGIRIIKLHGSLREEVIHGQFPDPFDVPTTLRESLEHYLKQDTVIVGSVMRDQDITRLLNAREKNRIYYAIARQSSHDSVVKLMESRGENIQRSLISGKYAEFTTFFQVIEEMLLTDRSSLPIPAVVSAMSRGDTPVDNNRFSADVLLVAVTDVEVKAVLACCQDHKLCFIYKRAYYDLGVIGGAKTFLVQSEMGSDGLGGSRPTVQEGIRALSPSAVIMVGIAYGLDEKKQRIGDILVSRQLVAYDYQRVGAAPEGEQMLHIRGDRISAPVWLLDRFKAGLQTWQEPPRVDFGLILSGGKLFANQSYRDQLYQSEREAIGGEMEGVGLYEAAQRHHVGWILVKAISDWADGSKNQNKARNQRLAAENAARFTMHVLQRTVFTSNKAESEQPSSLEQLSEIQQRIYNFIEMYINGEGMPPTNREIGHAMKIASTGHVNYHLSILEKKGWISRQAKKKRGIKLTLPSRKQGIPVMGYIAAGEPLDIYTDALESVDVGTSIVDAQDTYALIVRGNSMVEDHINDGDYVVIKRQGTCQNGDIIVAVHLQESLGSAGSATLKRFFQEKEHDRVRLQRANSELDPILIPKSVWDREWQIQGRVVAIFRQVPTK